MRMIELRRILSSDTPEYRFVEALMVRSFPPEEYRDLEELRRFTERNMLFCNNIVCDGAEPVGLVTWWNFGEFRYVEHLAMSPELRNGGYGGAVLELLQSLLPGPVVLEVEIPEEEMAVRRVEFYRRHGFVLWGSEYMQPPYRRGDEPLPMRLMVRGDLDCGRDFDTVRGLIYREVYGEK